MNEPRPNRHWFRFSLLTLFLVVTSIGGGLGYVMNWIGERHNALAKKQVEVPELPSPTPPITAPAPPPILGILGEQGYANLLFRIESEYGEMNPREQAEHDRLQALFPEAKFWVATAKAPAPQSTNSIVTSSVRVYSSGSK